MRCRKMKHQSLLICVLLVGLSFTTQSSQAKLVSRKFLSSMWPFSMSHGSKPAQNNCTTTTPTPEHNKALIIQMYDLVLGQKDVTNIDKYFVEDVIEHNPYVADGLEARRLTLINGTISGAPVTIEIQRITAEENYVWVQSKFPIPNLDSVFAVVDIFRFHCGLIQEHWDVLQNTKLSVPSLNPHPFF